MLEVVFSENAKGSLKVAQHCADSAVCGAVGLIFSTGDGRSLSENEMAEAQKQAEEKMKKRQKKAVSIGGDERDVFCFANDLSTGDISEDCLSKNRSDYISDAYAVFSEERTYYLAAIEEAKESLTELIRRSNLGEAIRIWYSEQPHEYCGMCWLISELKKRMPQLPRLSTIKLPNRVEVENTIVNYMGWGGVSPEDFHKFLPLEKEVTPAFICAAVLKWNEMQGQNTTLRVFINGTLQSVPEDFYDSFIKTEIDKMDTEFQEAKLICNILGKYQLGIGDLWIAVRIEKMIENGVLVPITKPEPSDMIYRRMLKKTNVSF